MVAAERVGILEGDIIVVGDPHSDSAFDTISQEFLPCRSTRSVAAAAPVQVPADGQSLLPAATSSSRATHCADRRPA